MLFPSLLGVITTLHRFLLPQLYPFLPTFFKSLQFDLFSFEFANIGVYVLVFLDQIADELLVFSSYWELVVFVASY